MPTPTASEIIERVKARYEGCRSYEDTGAVVRVRKSGPHPWQRRTTLANIRTRFVRPTLMYVELVVVGVGPKDEWERRVVIQNNQGVSDWWSVTAPSKLAVEQDIRFAIYCLSQVCEAATITPFLLLTDLRWRPWLPDASTCELLDSDFVEGHACYVVEGPRSLMMIRIWIDQLSFLVRKWESRDRYSDSDREHVVAAMRDELAAPSASREARIALENAIANIELAGRSTYTVTTATWDPHMDIDIDPKVFEFTPPG